MSGGINKKAFFTLFAAITISGFVVICTLGQTVHSRRVESKHASITSAQSAPTYTVMETEEGICVFRGDDRKPYMRLSCDPGLLSDYDRAQLAEGISFGTEAELRRYIEDIST